MKRFLLFLFLALVSLGFAQQNATLSGIIKTENELSAGTRVALQLIDRNGVWLRETGGVTPVAGTFFVTAAALTSDDLVPFRSGAVTLPDLQNNYRVSPDNVNFARALLSVYVDENSNRIFDRNADSTYVGIARLDEPVGWFVLLYVDQNATLSAPGQVNLNLAAGWNVFTVRYPEGGDTQYNMTATVDDIVLDVLQ